MCNLLISIYLVIATMLICIFIEEMPERNIGSGSIMYLVRFEGCTRVRCIIFQDLDPEYFLLLALLITKPELSFLVVVK